MGNKAKKILIIDDDNRNVFALSAVLKARGYKCVAAGNGQEGLEQLENELEIGIVLMDMMMPEMDGYTMIPLIRANELIAAVPIVAVTAQAMVGDKEKCIAAGADAYLSKPVDVDKLIDLLDNHLI